MHAGRKSRGVGHANPHRLAVQEGAVARDLFQSMAQRVAEIQRGAQPGPSRSSCPTTSALIAQLRAMISRQRRVTGQDAHDARSSTANSAARR
jgi:hypothetical protein